MKVVDSKVDTASEMEMKFVLEDVDMLRVCVEDVHIPLILPFLVFLAFDVVDGEENEKRG